MTAKQNGSFAGKVAFVTGAASGIGRAAAVAFAREGVRVVAADVSEQDNQKTASLAEKQGGRALAIRCDVTRVEDVKARLAAFDPRDGQGNERRHQQEQAQQGQKPFAYRGDGRAVVRTQIRPVA